MNISVVRGRGFEDRDNQTARKVIIIDEKLAKRFWPKGDPLGQRMFNPDGAEELTPGPKTKWMTIVGVVKSVRLEDLAGSGNSAGAYYMPFAQNPSRGAYTGHENRQLARVCFEGSPRRNCPHRS